MSAFRDIYIPVGTIGFPMSNGPRWSTTIIGVSSGQTQRNINWKNPLRKYEIPEAIRDFATFQGVYDHWLAMHGPAYTVPLRDPLDCASVPMVAPNVPPVTSRLDCYFGTGDGVTRAFQLTKPYTVTSPADAMTYNRDIFLPVVDTIEVSMNGVAPEDVPGGLSGGPYSVEVEREGGVVTFDHPPKAGVVLKWGGLFDVNVRFEADDSFDAAVKTYRVAGYANMTFVEERLC